jgi:hypothetical protein
VESYYPSPYAPKSRPPNLASSKAKRRSRDRLALRSSAALGPVIGWLSRRRHREARPAWGVVALAAVLLAGCGGVGDDRAKVEASLQHFLLGLVPGEARFPIGAGAPRVKDNGCFKLEGGSVWPNPLEVSPPSRLTRWNCVVKFGTLAIPVTVAVDAAAEVVAATQGGMLREGKPNASQPSTNSD